MSGYADELLNDLGSDGEEEQQEQQPENGAQDDAGDTSGIKRKWQDDLDDLDSGDEESGKHDSGNGTSSSQEPSAKRSKLELNEHSVKPTAELAQEDIKDLDFGPGSVNDVSAISSLLASDRLQSAVSKINQFEQEAKELGGNVAEQMQVDGMLEHSEEYQLIVIANNLAVEIENEITLVHKFVRDHYRARFPELETIVPKNWEYIQAVEAVQNTPDLTSPAKGSLESLLPRELVVPISIAASTSTGRLLAEDEWSRVQKGIQVVYQLADVLKTILNYVESRMSFIAPNLSALVGTSVATKLLGVAGGLTGLVKIPACNVQVLGTSKVSSVVGLSSISYQDRHIGFINQAPLMNGVPPEYVRQAARLISAKICLTARVDANHSQPLGTYGAQLKQELTTKIDKLMEPPPAKMTKALPVPQEGGNKKQRGGRRARKLKEMYGASELRKAANRVEFGKAEEEVGAFDETVGLGMAGSSSSNGRIRAAAGESRTKAKMSKKNQNRLEALKRASNARPNLDTMMADSDPASTYGTASSASSGTQTSLAFTPVQGIELADPSAAAARQRKIDEANDKWFRQGQFSLAPGVKGASSIVPQSANKGNMGPPSSFK
ncbi:unnamed protein product [Sympodiomycopsis kandeliae]